FEISTFSAGQTFPSFADRDSGAVGPAWLTVQKTVRRVLRNVHCENKTREPVSSRICNIAKISLTDETILTPPNETIATAVTLRVGTSCPLKIPQERIRPEFVGRRNI
ncbi:MAG: hypothetical protein ABGZ24_16580, partial [Fuerstiella sp.]